MKQKRECVMKKLYRLLKKLVCLGVITAALGCAATQKHESTGQYLDDSAITTKVKTAIFNDASLKSLQINVTTYKGIVQLSGFVDSAQNIKTAGELAGGISGVISVNNDLLIK
jgi:osmotically-inducible protein OsmY